MINVKNLKIARDWIAENVTEEQFNMEFYTNGEYELDPRCGTVGCLLGWSVFPKEFNKIINKIINKSRELNWFSFFSFSKNAFNVEPRSLEWDFLFSGGYTDHDNTLAGALGRMDVMIKYPDLFEEEK